MLTLCVEDVGHGLLVYIKCFKSHSFYGIGSLYKDVEKKKIAEKYASQVKPNETVNVIISQLDKDHCNILPFLLSSTHKSVKFRIVVGAYDKIYKQEFETKMNEFFERIEILYGGNEEQIKQFMFETDFDTHFFPLKEEDSDSLNTRSMISRIEYGEFSALLPGDADMSTVDILRQKSPLHFKSTILIPSRHGSSTNAANSCVFLEQVSPEVCVISCGASAPHRLPSEHAILNMLYVCPLRDVSSHTISSFHKSKMTSQETSKALFTTSDNGSVVFKVSNNETVVAYCQGKQLVLPYGKQKKLIPETKKKNNSLPLILGALALAFFFMWQLIK